MTHVCHPRITQLVPTLEQRTWELMECFERRQAAGKGYVDMVEIMYHVAYDFMVSSDQGTLRRQSLANVSLLG